MCCAYASPRACAVGRLRGRLASERWPCARCSRGRSGRCVLSMPSRKEESPMTHQDTPFERKRIDDEIARLERLDWTRGPVTPDARLIADLRHTYRRTADDVQSL